MAKEAIGGQGSGVHIIQADNEGDLLNGGEPLVPAELASELQTGNFILTEVIEQADYAEEIFPASVNTLRIITLVDSETNEPFIATAVHRFGTNSSAPVDNWSDGGVCAEIDPKTGELGAVASFSDQRELRMDDRHPNTGTRISEREIPD